MKNTSFEEWLEKFRELYEFKLEITAGENYFNHRMLDFWDPKNLGMPFTIYVNSDGNFSLLSSEWADLKYFNVAEGYESEDIQRAAELILAGKVLNSDGKLQIITSRGVVTARMLNNSSPKAYGLRI